MKGPTLVIVHTRRYSGLEHAMHVAGSHMLLRCQHNSVLLMGDLIKETANVRGETKRYTRQRHEGAQQGAPSRRFMPILTLINRHAWRFTKEKKNM
jgi:hypothetical protein